MTWAEAMETAIGYNRIAGVKIWAVCSYYDSKRHGWAWTIYAAPAIPE